MSSHFMRGISKTLIVFTICILGFLVLAKSDAIEGLFDGLDDKQTSPSVQKSAAEGVLRRLLPNHLSSFEFEIVRKDACGGSKCFWIANHNGTQTNRPEIIIKGTTAVELSSGLHWYLKYWCGAHISWEKTGGIQIASVPKPGSLPPVNIEGVKIQRPTPWNYYQNVVTSSYSYVWWDWEAWEKELDWMALQGINLPLAFTGQETVWQKVFMDFNVSQQDLNDFFGGPAFLAWARMGNLHAWGGPLTQNWLDQQLALQKQILTRMRELGMTPVLPSFSGIVPAALRKVFPSANITRLGDWNTVSGDPRWCCTYLLDPSDPLFVQIGEAFIKQQIKEYGDVTDVYNCDTFNENTPPTNDTTFISTLGAAVFNAMSKGNKNAVWLMQGWLFYSSSWFWKPPQIKALVHSVPFGKMIVLDLFAEAKPIWKQSSHFYGTPYIWCMLHNFGGNIEMYGILDSVGSGPVDARTSTNSTMVGVGMCMEGINQNPIVYELMSEMAFRSEKVKVESWLKSYSARRYGKKVTHADAAWKLLHRSIYNCTDGIANHNTDYIVKLPDWDPSSDTSSRRVDTKWVPDQNDQRRFLSQDTGSHLPQPHMWYYSWDATIALQLFLNAGKKLNGSLTYRYDLVDLTRQALSKLANDVYLDAIKAFQRKDLEALNRHARKFFEIIRDTDMLLASDDNFLLGTWLESAKKLAVTPSERKQYEWNARTQVTMWYDTTKDTQSHLHDYANKFWSGLLVSYYLPRATLYINHLSESLKQNTPLKIEEWREEWIAYSTQWQAGTESYPTTAKGDALTISNKLYQKYFHYCIE